MKITPIDLWADYISRQKCDMCGHSILGEPYFQSDDNQFQHRLCIAKEVERSYEVFPKAA